MAQILDENFKPSVLEHAIRASDKIPPATL